MEHIQTTPKTLVLRHDLLCLDFTNTVFWRLRKEPLEGFRDYSVLVKWSRKIGLLGDSAAETLLWEAEASPDEAALTLHRVIWLREAVYRVLVSAVEGRQPEPEDLDSLNLELSEMHTRKTLFQKKNGFDWGWRIEDRDLDQMLWPILNSVAVLLTSPDLKRIGVCRGEGCGWLFYDQSRNHSRKWCNMGDCGNRAKARRFYQRKLSNQRLN